MKSPAAMKSMKALKAKKVIKKGNKKRTFGGRRSFRPAGEQDCDLKSQGYITAAVPFPPVAPADRSPPGGHPPDSPLRHPSVPPRLSRSPPVRLRPPGLPTLGIRTTTPLPVRWPSSRPSAPPDSAPCPTRPSGPRPTGRLPVGPPGSRRSSLRPPGRRRSDTL